MFRDAVKELRHHPGRIVATLVAIAISVGFMAAVSIFVTTQSDALGRSLALTTSKADVVAEVNNPKADASAAQVRKAVGAVPGVKAVEQSVTGQISLSTDRASQFVQVFSTPGEDFRWAKLTAGSYPTANNQIAVAKQVADKLGVGVGQTVKVGEQQLTVSGITDEPRSVFFQTAYAAPVVLADQAGAGGAQGTWLVKASDPGSAANLTGAVRSAVAPFVDNPDEVLYGDVKGLQVSTGEQAQSASIKQVTGDFDVMKYVLLVFSAIAALVGMIIIANTFTILLAQRRRQIGLLRAVGASGAQVRRRFLAEAVLLGIIGSALGLLLGTLIAWAGASYTGASYWGLSFPTSDLLVEFGVGVLMTVLAAMLPSLRATRVAPLEALQPVATSEQVRRTSIVRALVCGLFLVGGIALAVMSLGASKDSTASGPVALAVLGAILITIAVLFGAPLYVPLLLRTMGGLFGLFGATPKLAAANAVRNPRRASATATALMLACGLIITLQVGTATAEKTVLGKIKENYPIDVTVSVNPMSGGSTPGATADRTLSTAQLGKLHGLPNVKHQATLMGGRVSDAAGQIDQVVTPNDDSRAVTDVLPAIADDQVVTSSQVTRGTRITLKGNGTSVTLTSVPSTAMEGSIGAVSPATLAKLVKKPTPQLQWIQLANTDDLGTTMTPLTKMQQAEPNLMVSGSAANAFMISKVLDILLMITMGLLGAAVLIALIGVSNTLGLSVIERARESALLRALGMQKGSLRLMLLVEALMLALAGVLVGVVAGSFFGWLGIRAVMRQADMHGGVQFAVDLPMTLGLVAIAVVAAALASVLPGRRAASATPTEALAEE